MKKVILAAIGSLFVVGLVISAGKYQEGKELSNALFGKVLHPALIAGIATSSAPHYCEMDVFTRAGFASELGDRTRNLLSKHCK